jgi:hypothetical protein
MRTKLSKKGRRVENVIEGWLELFSTYSYLSAGNLIS